MEQQEIRKKLKRYEIPGHARELTFSCNKKYKYLKDTVACSIFMEEFAQARRNYGFLVWAYMLMPTHVHLLIWPQHPEYKVSTMLNTIKGRMAHRYRAHLQLNQPEVLPVFHVLSEDKKAFRFWQAGGGFDRNFWSPRAIHNSIRYIENNPVRAGLATTPESWVWSSAYAREHKTGLVPDETGIPILETKY